MPSLKKTQACILVNFGGPRSLEEIPHFLTELLTDQDVIQTSFPSWLHKILFSYVARKRAKKVVHDYEMIGGKSPIFEDTELLAKTLQKAWDMEVIPFHRYLPSTHKDFFSRVESLEQKEILVFPMFPQFSYATTGSIARFFSQKLCGRTLQKMLWIKSYAAHDAYIESMQKVLHEFLQKNHLSEDQTVLLFSAHGLPQKFVCTGDIYQKECEISFAKISDLFPKAKSYLCYQSKFGKGLWLTPSTEDLCKSLEEANETKKAAVIVPLSFTSDHIETLFEIEMQYLPLLKEKKYASFRCPALNHHSLWIESIQKIIKDPSLLVKAPMLIRHKKMTRGCKDCCRSSCPCQGSK